MKTIVVHHSADFDGLFSGAVCKHFLPDAELIGWDFGDEPILLEQEVEKVFVVDLPPTCLAAWTVQPGYTHCPTVWIDHHKSSIEKFEGLKLPGFRIDGVAACRLCWSYFTDPDREQMCGGGLSAEYFQKRLVSEPLALTLAGEYDIWDLHDPKALPFQFGLTARGETVETLDKYLAVPAEMLAYHETLTACEEGKAAMHWQKAFASSVQRISSYIRTFEDVTFCVLASVHARNSMWFPDVIEGVQALMSWRYDGDRVSFSLYHAPGHEDIDLSPIAVKYGGGGHRGACGFSLPLDEALEIIR